MRWRLLLFSLPLLSLCCSSGQPDKVKNYVLVQWVKELPGDYSFKEKWEYPMGVYKNDWGQVSCDGFCPERCDNMKDTNGRILKDSLKEFYKVLDTTHEFHSIDCDAWCYEWGGTDFMHVYKNKSGKFHANTMCNAGTHCSLNLTISGDTCTPVIELTSIVPGGDATYHITKGFMKIDQGLWQKGILKAEFNFDFFNPEKSDRAMFWKGKVWAEVRPEE